MAAIKERRESMAQSSHAAQRDNTLTLTDPDSGRSVEVCSHFDMRLGAHVLVHRYHASDAFEESEALASDLRGHACELLIRYPQLQPYQHSKSILI